MSHNPGYRPIDPDVRAKLNSMNDGVDYRMAKLFWEVDTVLYNHETPFYRACAGGAHFEVTEKWKEQRQRLRAAWDALNPCNVPEPGTPRFPKWVMWMVISAAVIGITGGIIAGKLLVG